LPNCYTCGEDITFDKNILSKTGKQIPLTADKKYTHGHDEQGNPTKKPLPNQDLSAEQTQQFNQYNRQQTQTTVKSPTTGYTATTSNTPSQGGAYMDTKRLRVMVEELQKQVNELEQKLESHVIIDSNRYENQMQIIYQKLGPLMDSTLTAAEMYKQKQTEKEPEVKGWNTTPNNDDGDDEKNES
jgi:hypothetical protein